MILLISLKKKRTTNSATTKAQIKPTMKNGIRSELKLSQCFTRLRKLAPIMIGIAIINVKSAAARWFNPRITPPEMVEPEREKPGQRARH